MFLIRLEEKNGIVSCQYTYSEVNAVWKVLYRVLENGVIRVENSFVIKDREDLPLIPRVGLLMQLPLSMNKLVYYGRGPWENYCDRKTGAFIGKYELDATTLYEPYIRPQENNHRTDVRWLALSDKNGNGLLFVPDSVFEFNASSYPMEAFDSGDDIYNDNPVSSTKWHRHNNDPLPQKYIDLCLDDKMMGVGGDNSWGATPHEQYLIRAEKQPFSYEFL